jgi:hypothetical protein
MVLLWTHCRGQAVEREERRNSPGTGENRGTKKTKNNTNEASKLLKTLKCCRNEAKKYMKTRELFKNSGNEAKKWLKTKHIAIFGDANYARFVHQLAQI